MRIPRERLRSIGIAAVIFAVLFVAGRLLGSIDIQKVLHDVSRSLGAWTYALVGVAAFLETGAFVGLVLPGETVVILGGAVAGQGATSVLVTIAVVWICAWGGDTVSFLLGRRLGRGFVIRHGPKVRITEARFRKVESYFERYGGRTILIGRFIGLVRALAPFSAGSSGMRYRGFLPYSVLGTGLWAAVFTMIGYFASQSIDQAARVAGRGTLYLGLAAALIAGLVVAVRYLRVHENRERVVLAMESRGLLRPLLTLGRRLSPHARFAWARLTPGDLGIELTALLAIVAVGSFVLFAYVITVSGNPGPTAGDMTAFDVGAGHEAALGGAVDPRCRPGNHLRGGWCAEGSHRSAASERRPDRNPGIVVPQRARRAGTALSGASAPRRCSRLDAPRRPNRPARCGLPARRDCRSDQGVSARPLPQRRQRGLGAGGGDVCRRCRRGDGRLALAPEFPARWCWRPFRLASGSSPARR